MKQAMYGLVIYIFLMLPPVIEIAESIMVIHMHMQMPLLIIVGMLFTPFLKERFPNFFEKWNENGIPGILLFFIVLSYWMIPRAMDDALTSIPVEVFKFISLPFLAGVPLRDSWKKLTPLVKKVLYVLLVIEFGLLGYLYIFSDTQLCNNYVIAEQQALGWTFVIFAVCIFIYYLQTLFIKDYE